MRRTVDWICWLIDGFLTRIEKRAVVVRNRRLLANFKACGKGVGLYGDVSIYCPEEIEVGNNVHIGSGAYIRANGGLVIGDNTHISRNLLLYTTNHKYDGRRIPYDEESVLKPVKIGRNVWIGMNVCITPGTVIGDGAIVAMGTVVSGMVPALAIVGNQKWRIIGQRDEKQYRELDSKKAYGGPSGIQFDTAAV